MAWWVHETRFASDVRLLTEADVVPVALHNAKIFAAVRAADPEAEVVARRRPRPLRELSLFAP